MGTPNKSSFEFDNQQYLMEVEFELYQLVYKFDYL